MIAVVSEKPAWGPSGRPMLGSGSGREVSHVCSRCDTPSFTGETVTGHAKPVRTRPAGPQLMPGRLRRKSWAKLGIQVGMPVSRNIR